MNISLTSSVRPLGTETEPQTELKAKGRKRLVIVMLRSLLID